MAQNLKQYCEDSIESHCYKQWEGSDITIKKHPTSCKIGSKLCDSIPPNLECISQVCYGLRKLLLWAKYPEVWRELCARGMSRSVSTGFQTMGLSSSSAYRTIFIDSQRPDYNVCPNLQALICYVWTGNVISALVSHAFWDPQGSQGLIFCCHICAFKGQDHTLM